MIENKVSLQDINNLVAHPRKCVFYTTSFLELVLRNIIERTSDYDTLLEILVEELLFRKFISSIESSFDLSFAIQRVAPDFKEINSLLRLEFPKGSIQEQPIAIKQALVRVSNWLYSNADDSVQAKILVTLDLSGHLKNVFRSELCLGIRFGRQVDNPCLDSSYSQRYDFEKSVKDAEAYAAELTQSCLGQDDKFREVILCEPKLDDFPIILSGTSASTTLLFAHLGHFRYDLPLSPSATFSCSIDFDSKKPVYRPVNGIKQKVKAALDAGLKTLFIHNDNYEEAKRALNYRFNALHLEPISGEVENNWENILPIFSNTDSDKKSELVRLLENYNEIGNIERKSKFWYSEVMPVKINEMKRNWKNNGNKTGIDCLICSVSTSDTVIMAFWCVLPKNIILLMGQLEDNNNKNNLEQIKRFVLEDSYKKSSYRIGPENFKIIPIPKYNKSFDLYTNIDNALQDFLDPNLEVFAEITGGTKPMSSVLSQYAWQHDMQTIYIRSDSNEIGRRIEGTQELIPLINPKEILQEEAFNQALKLFNEGRYNSAMIEFEKISEITETPKSSRFMKVLSEFYNYRMLLNYDKAKETAIHLNKQFQQKTLAITPMAVEKHLQEQIKGFLQVDKQEFLLAELYHVADRKEEVGDYNIALILFYRFLEGVIARRLKVYGIFDTGKPNYAKILEKHTEEKLVADLKSKLSFISLSFLPDGKLPSRLGLFMAGALLDILEDKVVTRVNEKEITEVLYSLADTRNSSILSHGFQSANATTCSRFKNIAKLFLQKSLLDFTEDEVDTFLEKMDFQIIEFIN